MNLPLIQGHRIELNHCAAIEVVGFRIRDHVITVPLDQL